MQGKTPAYTMMIPNALQLLWRKHRKLEDSLGRPQSEFVEMANWCLDGLRLRKGVSSIENRLSTENGRFHSAYAKLGGAKRQSLSLKVTKMLVVLNEIDIISPPVTASRTEVIGGLQVSLRQPT